MLQQLKLIILCSIAYFAAFFILSRLTPYKKELKDYMVFSITLIAAAAITKAIIVVMILAVFLCNFFIRGKTNGEKIAFFFGVVFALPYDSAIHFHFGVNLGSLSYPTLMALCLLLPLLLFQRKDQQFCKLNFLDKVSLALFVWLILLTIRLPTITSTFREGFWLAVQFIIPYLAVRYFVRDYYLVFAAIFFGLLAQMFISSMEGVLSWKMYESLRQISQYPDFRWSMYKFRHGFLRSEAVFGNSLVTSLFANFTFLLAYIVYRRTGMQSNANYSKIFALAAMGIAFVGTFMTGSRAGLAGIVFIIGVYHVVIWASKRKSDPKKMLIPLAIIGLTTGLYLGGDFIQKNFEYRYQVFFVSLDFIKDNWLVGKDRLDGDPRMESLRQGEGIIDIVNSYVSFTLHQGLPGLILHLLAFFGALSRIYTVIRNVDDERYTLGIFLLCSMVVLMFNLATTSPLGWTYYWIWFLIPMSSAMHTQYLLETKPPRTTTL